MNDLRCSRCESFDDPDDHHAGPCDWMADVLTILRTEGRAS